MPFKRGKYLLKIAKHVESRFYSLLDELEALGTDALFLGGLDNLAGTISQGGDPDDTVPLSGCPGFWAVTIQGVRLDFSVDEDELWVVVEYIP